MTRFSITSVLTLSLVAGGATSAQATGEGIAQMTYDQALACVATHIPASSYFTNDFIPAQPVDTNITPLAEPEHLRLGVSWVLNDQYAPFYIAIANGYFEQEGLDIELVGGGPGRNQIQTLAGGAVDVAVHGAGNYIPLALTSPTPVLGIRAIGAIMQGNPASLLTIRPELQGRALTPADLEGRIVAGAPFLQTYLPIMLDKAGIDPASVEVMPAGPAPDVLYAEAADFYLGWVFNQTRDIEARGIPWNGVMWRDFAFDNYTDVIVMRQSMLDDPHGQDVAQRFMRATYRAVEFLLDNPEAAADITLEHAIDAPGLTREAVLFRFERQAFLIRDESHPVPLAMSEEFWDTNTATLLQYGYLDNVQCEE